ncbi:VOC family protein [uncultured Alsobacter sp.]|uniref:VOC family protein n=1 Tax=uncultured Alsobacter sp. TaxID=1748258 RepID=UPI0025DCDCB0|nr:VOC family protein [uncultured Alsobacter sp.]
MACILETGTGQMPGAPADGLAIDHIGIVVQDLAAEVAAWRAAGFRVSDPEPLMGRSGEGQAVPLGQSSAHVVFENGYVELSSPVPGSGNHLEPYLAKGEGVRILVLAAADAPAARAALLRDWPGVPDVREASREVVLADAARRARFSWFPLPFDVVPGVLSAVVQHHSRDIVLHPSLCTHPNGLRRMDCIVATGTAGELRRPGVAAGEPDAPRLALLAGDRALAITALRLSRPGGETVLLRIA